MSGALPALASGVYGIFNTETRKVYVGQSCNVARRFAKHRAAPRAGRHINKHLQAAWGQYGEDSFEFRVIELVPEALLNPREVSWIDFYKAADPAFGYNKTYGGDGGRGQLTPEVREKIAAANRGRVTPPEVRAKQSAARLGRKFGPRDPAVVEKIRQANLGKKRTPEHNTRMSLARKGIPRDPAAAAKSAAALRGRKKPPRSAEHARKIGEANRGRKRAPHTPEARAKLSAARRGKARSPLSPAHKEKIRLGQLAFRAKQRAEKASRLPDS